MTLIVPNVAEVKILELIFARTLSCHLYSNDITPADGNTVGTFTEVTGGGYASKTLITGLWTITSGDPTEGNYNIPLDFSFTGVIGGSGFARGYYIKDSTGILWAAERFPTAVQPFAPINGSLIRFTPHLECS